jgi:hypothetical protein
MVRDCDIQFLVAYEARRQRFMHKWKDVSFYNCDYCKRAELNLYYFLASRNKVLCVNCYGMHLISGLVDEQ